MSQRHRSKRGERAPTSPWAARLLKRAERVLLAAATVVAAWWIAALLTNNSIMLPVPPRVVSAIVNLTLSAEIPEQLGATLYRVGVAFTLAAATAIPLGMLIGLVPLARRVLDPTIEVLRPIPAIAWIPVIMILVGVGDVLAISIVFYAAFFPILLNTVLAAQGLDPRHREAARTLGASRLHQIWHVIMPGMLPTVVAGLRIGIAFGWMSVVAAELIGASSGLGYRMLWYQQNFASPNVLAYMVVIGLTGLALDRKLGGLGVLVTPWRAKGGPNAQR